MKENEIAYHLGHQILINWEENGITIRSLATQASQSTNIDLDNEFGTIEEESQTKAMKIFQEFQNNGKIDPRDFAGMDETQIVNKFLS